MFICSPPFFSSKRRRMIALSDVAHVGREQVFADVLAIDLARELNQLVVAVDGGDCHLS
jgi:hypothetical protein